MKHPIDEYYEILCTQVANTNVRNVGSIAGNLMLKHAHNDFPSDIFNLLEAAGARIGVINTMSQISLYSPIEFLSADMDRKVILFISMPTLPTTAVFMSYKITPRSQNAHAYVNAAMQVRVPGNSNYFVNQAPILVFGGISGSFFRATATENYLNGKNLNDEATLQTALTTLDGEISPVEDPVLASVAYRKHLVKACFYKASVQNYKIP